MSEQREFIDVKSGVPIATSQALAQEAEENRKRRAEKKQRIARVLTRGVIIDRLHVDLPEGLYGEWMPNDKLAIAEAELLGFRVDTQYARKNALHKDADGGASVLGDVVFMICDREDKDIIDELRAEAFEAAHGKRGKGGQKEEREFQNQLRALDGFPIVDESATRAARKEELKDALQAMSGAEKPNSSTIIK